MSCMNIFSCTRLPTVLTSVIGSFREPLRASTSFGLSWKRSRNASATFCFSCTFWLTKKNPHFKKYTKEHTPKNCSWKLPCYDTVSKLLLPQSLTTKRGRLHRSNPLDRILAGVYVVHVLEKEGSSFTLEITVY